MQLSRDNSSRLNQLARSLLTIIITEIFVKKGGPVRNETKAPASGQDEIPTLPAPDDAEQAAESSMPPIPNQSDVRQMAQLAIEAKDTAYEEITKRNASRQ
jgi:hypothetical protein